MDLSIFPELINCALKATNYFLSRSCQQCGRHPTTYTEWEIWLQLWKLTNTMENSSTYFLRALKI